MEGPTIEAVLELASTADGGRRTPIESGYRSLAHFEGAGAGVGVGFELSLRLPLAPGGTGSGILVFWAELPRTEPGHRFEIREGTRVIGTGTVRGVAPLAPLP